MALQNFDHKTDVFVSENVACCFAKYFQTLFCYLLPDMTSCQQYEGVN